MPTGCRSGGQAGGQVRSRSDGGPGMDRASSSADHAAQQPTASRRQPSRSEWVRAGIAALGAVAAVVAVVLIALGAGEGPVILLMGAVGGVATFATSLWGVLKPFGERQRLVFGMSVAGLAIVLVGVGLATRAVAPLPVLDGAQDVAIAGFRSSDESVQQQFDAAASSLADDLHSPAGEVSDYTPLVNPPLDQLAGAATDGLDRWARSFVADTQAELVLAGYASVQENKQTSVELGLFVSPELAIEAAEVAGWYRLEPLILERPPGSATERDRLKERIQDALDGLLTLLRGLDAWHAGEATEAVDVLSTLPGIDQTPPDGTVAGLGLLIRGHALQDLAAAAPSEEATQLLARARSNYEAAAAAEELAKRAAVSLGLNAYLEVARLCAIGQAADEHLLAAAQRLRAVIAASTASELLRLKAGVNLAQVQLCRAQSGPADTTELDTLLQDLVTIDTTGAGAEQVIRRQLKALALSVYAVRLSTNDDFAPAVAALDDALALEPRSHRQAVWHSLQAVWLLQQCRTSEAQDVREEALRQATEAADRGRLPATWGASFDEAFNEAMEASAASCSDAGHRAAAED